MRIVHVNKLLQCKKMDCQCPRAAKQPCSSALCRIFAETRKQPVFRALEDIIKKHGHLISSRRYDNKEGPPDASDLLFRVRSVFDEIEHRYDEVFGPNVSLQGKSDLPDQEYIMAVDFNDFDGSIDSVHRYNRCALLLPDEFDWLGTSDWHDSGWRRAASAYRQEAGWDFTPDATGVWLAAVLPTSETSSNSVTSHYICNLIGFVILQDRNKDGRYESLAHLWTAQIARRKGVASRLLAAARETFPLTTVEWPVTNNGTDFLKARWPRSIA